ncbi:MAG: AhpC/TSA family protein [Rhodobacteraceae bacterium]|nr:AhpC/TSA family protein [Paracoccaceae bacterium]
MPATKLQAGEAFPKLNVPQLGGGTLRLGTPAEGRDWQLVVVYRGKHCPICTTYLGELNGLLDEFEELGVDVVAVSGDPEEKARAQMEAVEPRFPVGYDLSVEQMAALGLYISDPRSPQETDRPFAEPGIFVVNADGRIQILDISNAPFARPSLQSLVRGIRFVRNPDNNYPIRGTHAA